MALGEVGCEMLTEKIQANCQAMRERLRADIDYVLTFVSCTCDSYNESGAEAESCFEWQ